MKHRSLSIVMVLLIVSLLAAACAPAATAPAPTQAPAPAQPAAPAQPTSAPAQPPGGEQVLRLATTTSTADSGLLDAILPDFQAKFNARVDVVAVGTGQAIEIGTRGDADVLLVHARKSEDKFVADGFAKERFDVMYNDFILLGPKADPAGILGRESVKDAFNAILNAEATFASRGDKSGTHSKELSVWTSLEVTPTNDMKWYQSLGQGMGDTLVFANEQGAYTVADRGTYLAMKDKLPNLIVAVGGNTIDENKDKTLLNPYGVMAVNPDTHPGVNYDLAMKFVTWLNSVETQQLISDYGKDTYGAPLFYPSSAEWKAAHP
jgi:tungstate transport system substrate-binding protein